MAEALNWRLFKAMAKEEFRLHQTMIGPIGSGFFPVMIFLFSVVLAVAFGLLGKVDIPTVLLLLHGGALLYGLGVGALGLIGEAVMTRRLGQVSFLLQVGELQPVTFRKVMAIFFLKDALYYLVYSLVPLIGGIALAAPFAHISLGGVGALALTLCLTFMTGMSLSFLLSAVAVRSRIAGAAFGGVVALLALAVWPGGALKAGDVLLPLGYWTGAGALDLVLGGALAVAFAIAAVLLMKERFEPPLRAYASQLLPTESRFAFTGALKTLAAKEWLELRRSGGLGAVVAGYLAPLLAVYAMAWVFRRALAVPIEFNAVFYGGMVGFLGVMVYSWLTNLEGNEFLNGQPATVGDVIRAKLVLYFLLTTVVSFSYLALIALAAGQVAELPLALVVAFATTAYVGGVITRLTGLWTNTMLFDARVLAKFFAAVVPPLVFAVIASFWIPRDPVVPAVLLLSESALLLVASRSLLRGVAKRWGGKAFSMGETSPSSV